jgi:hypothetical protein
MAVLDGAPVEQPVEQVLSGAAPASMVSAVFMAEAASAAVSTAVAIVNLGAMSEAIGVLLAFHY